jgi:hypothetical protein
MGYSANDDVDDALSALKTNLVSLTYLPLLGIAVEVASGVCS